MEQLQNLKTGRRTSFYGKALINKQGKNLSLYSYRQHVLTASAPVNGKYYRLQTTPLWDYSMTTLTHVREFIAQFMSSAWFRAVGLNPKNLSKKNLEKAVTANSKLNKRGQAA